MVLIDKSVELHSLWSREIIRITARLESCANTIRTDTPHCTACKRRGDAKSITLSAH
jgi:hypothetical protein